MCGWPVRVATTHLESPTGWDQLFSEQRVAQCMQAAAVLDKAREGDVLFAGDMNWGPNDGAPPLPAPQATESHGAGSVATKWGRALEARSTPRGGAQMWHKVAWPVPSRNGDAFHSILLELQRKRRYFKASTHTWWL